MSGEPLSSYLAYIDEAGRIRAVRELRTCADDAEALTVLLGLARRHDRLELWDRERLVRRIEPAN
jgi:DNA-binding transcriptional regulator/RsmH inhibitor MraZ